MHATGYGIELKRVSIEDIELIREWRNSDFVKMTMEYREEITSDRQLKWFHSINTLHQNYCLIKYKNEYVGVIHGSDIDWNTGITHNGGIFLKDESYTLTDIPLRASFLLTDCSFAFGHVKTIIKVLNDNKRAIFYNESIGYRLIHKNDTYSNYELTEENYLLYSEKFKALIQSPTDRKIVITIDRPDDPFEKTVWNIFNQRKNAPWDIEVRPNPTLLP
jgi:RimJ/RimL family protein N-acetyltransferase